MEAPVPKRQCLIKSIYQRRQFSGLEISLPSELTGVIHELDIYKDIEMAGYFKIMRNDNTYPIEVWEFLKIKMNKFIVDTDPDWFQISYGDCYPEIDIHIMNNGKIHISGMIHYDDFIRIRFFLWRFISLYIKEFGEDITNWKISNINIASCSIKLLPFAYPYYAQYTREPLKLVYKILSDVPVSIIEHLKNLHDFELNDKDALVIDVQMVVPENNGRNDYDCYAVVSGGLIEYSDKDFIQPGMKNVVANLVATIIHDSPINVVMK